MVVVVIDAPCDLTDVCRTPIVVRSVYSDSFTGGDAYFLYGVMTFIVFEEVLSKFDLRHEGDQNGAIIVHKVIAVNIQRVGEKGRREINYASCRGITDKPISGDVDNFGVLKFPKIQTVFTASGIHYFIGCKLYIIHRVIQC